MFYYERKFLGKGYKLILGVDEVGRGPLAGPVVAACVAIPSAVVFISKVDDSKKLTPDMRRKAFLEITRKCPYGLGVVNESVIDTLNILNSTRAAMQTAIADLLEQFTPLHPERPAFQSGDEEQTKIKSSRKPRLLRRGVTGFTAVGTNDVCVIIDGRMSLPLEFHSQEIIGGDRKSLSIAAASVVAKVIRDRMMGIYDKVFPVYGFSENKGYGTVKHISAIKKFGLSPIHRKTFCGNFCR